MDLFENRDFSPMLLSEEKDAFDSKDFIFELKFDGTRALIFVSQNNLVIMNRHGKNITYLYPELQEIKNYIKEKVIFDGEIVVFKEGKPSFLKLQERAHLKNKLKINYQSKNNPVIFVCFDILYKNKNLINNTLLERKKILSKFIDNDYFLKNKYIENDGKLLFKNIKKLGLEGIVAKRKNSKYQINKRTDDWIKIKNLLKESFYVGGYVISDKNVMSILLGESKNRKLYFVGKVVISSKVSLYKKIINSKIKNSSVFENYSNVANYIEPKYKCYVEYMERSKNNYLRQPVFRGEDK